jgi:hypothetical protein
MVYRGIAGLLFAAAVFGAETVPSTAGVTAHEWGTFTSVAALDGNPMSWYALSGPESLPCFIHRSQFVQKIGLSTVRMETPVLYFYTNRKMTLSVHVGFANGLLTEWYPKAEGSNPQRLEWNEVQLLPGENIEFPSSQAASHYYAARATDSVPLRIGGEQEKLLFYRGMGEIDVPLRPKLMDGGRIELRNTGRCPLPAAIVFENRGGKTGYRLVAETGGLREPMLVDLPALGDNLASLHDALAAELIRAGLYPKEAQAMLATWNDSWFEEGMRVFYILPPSAVDAAIPLAITPAAREITRVFVGRVEVLSPATQERIKAAAAAGDTGTLARLGRFLQPFWEEMNRHGAGLSQVVLGGVHFPTVPCAK